MHARMPKEMFPKKFLKIKNFQNIVRKSDEIRRNSAEPCFDARPPAPEAHGGIAEGSVLHDTV